MGLENTVYSTDDDDDSVVVCVYISFPPPNTPIPGVSDCPITFPFDLIFRLSSTSTGIECIVHLRSAAYSDFYIIQEYLK